MIYICKILICILFVFEFWCNHIIRSLFIPGPAVYFYAWNTLTLSNITTGTTLVFDNTVTNSGNGYNNTTGVFRAPFKSAYVFAWTILNSPGHLAEVSLKKNDEHVLYGISQASGVTGYGSGSNVAVLELNAGDKMHLEVTDNGASIIHQVWGHGTSTFSGWLLHY